MKKLNLNIQMFGSTNKTTNYELPQWVGTDKPSYLTDFNEAFETIDTAIHDVAEDSSQAISDVADLTDRVETAESTVSSLDTRVDTVESTVQSASTTATNAQQTATSALTTANTANGKADTNASNISSLSTAVGTINTTLANTPQYTTLFTENTDEIVQLKDSQNALLFPLTKRDIITGFAVAKNYANEEKVQLDSVVKIGTRLTYNTTNKNIVVGADVSHVLVSGCVYVNYNAENSKTYGGRILKNNTEVNRFQIYKSANAPISASGCPILIEVEEGDTIEMDIVSTSSSAQSFGGSHTNITVEVVD